MVAHAKAFSFTDLDPDDPFEMKVPVYPFGGTPTHRTALNRDRLKGMASYKALTIDLVVSMA
ncbi:MAG: hypothetical protein IPN44_08920 [Flavobacteriales bacterium]|nr:hypothetical protein [Flavobacteriales bacterium]